jgi:hypothetical protein
MRMEIRFVDTYGRGWSRDDNGVLESWTPPVVAASPEPAHVA